jgi:hypothetical protein
MPIPCSFHVALIVPPLLSAVGGFDNGDEFPHDLSPLIAEPARLSSTPITSAT